MKALVQDVRVRTRTARAARHLSSISNLRLALGSAGVPPTGWQGLDLFHRGTNVHCADLLCGIPVRSGSVDAILAEHILEHFFYDDVKGLIDDCYRALGQGGVIRVVSPDALNVARLLSLTDDVIGDPAVLADIGMHRWKCEDDARMRTINRIAYQWGEHKSLLTADSIAKILHIAGFTGIEMMTTSQSIYFDSPPDIHSERFPIEDVHLNFAVEARKA